MRAALRITSQEAQPFLKWAGGKRNFLPELRRHIPKDFRCYVEPFVGAGALFFDLQPARAILNDVNRELIQTYRAIRDVPEQVIEELEKHRYNREHYYEVRTQRPESLSLPALAARMIFLNRTGYNGLYRVNKKGEFNVPFGRYSNPRIVNRENIFACSESLQGVVLDNFDFRQFPWELITSDDLVYFDPPYVPLSKTSSFASYSNPKFGEEEQRELAAVFSALAARGVKAVLTNSSAELVRELYNDFRILEVSVPRLINSKAELRAGVSELLVLSF